MQQKRFLEAKHKQPHIKSIDELMCPSKSINWAINFVSWVPILWISTSCAFSMLFHWCLYGPAHTQSKQSISKAYHTHWWTHGFRYNGSELLVPFHCISIDFSMAQPIQNRSRAWATAYQNNWQTHVPIQVHRCCIGSFIVYHCFRYYGLVLLVRFSCFSLIFVWPCPHPIEAKH